jgi:hypothetical protein
MSEKQTYKIDFLGHERQWQQLVSIIEKKNSLPGTSLFVGSAVSVFGLKNLWWNLFALARI